MTDPANGELDIIGIATAGDLNLNVTNDAVATVQAFATRNGLAAAIANANVDNGMNVVGIAPTVTRPWISTIWQAAPQHRC